VLDDATFCDRCDAILDNSFLARQPVDTPRREDGEGAKGTAPEKTPDDIVADALNFYRAQHTGGRMSLVAAIAAVFFCFWPWASLPGEGWVSGLEIGSVFVVILMAAFITVFTLNRRSAGGDGWLYQHHLSIEVALLAVALLFCVYRLFYQADIPEETQVLKSSGYDLKSRVLLGLPLTMISALTAGAGLFFPDKK
jgi:hypothetical protein